MNYWGTGYAATLLVLFALLAVAGLIHPWIPRRFPIPRAMVAGAFGLVLGPPVLDILPIGRAQLEALIYHGLALVFILVSLQPSAREGARRGEGLSLGYCLLLILCVQGIFGMAVVAVVDGFGLGRELHAGFGYMGLLGFGTGPGQALALGSAWTKLGMEDGGAVGLIVAGLGFVWCTVAGTVWLGRGRPATMVEAEAKSVEPAVQVPPSTLMQSLLATALVYLATWGLLKGVDALLGEKVQLRAMVWGFHYLVGMLLAMGVRTVWTRADPSRASVFNGPALGTLAGLVVELTTAAALTAISISVFLDWLGPLLVLSIGCGVLTWIICAVLRDRVFENLPFEHALVLFGASTGTLLTGIALLRVIDPNLRTPVAVNMVRGAAIATPLGLIILLGIMPYTVTMWTPGSVASPLTAIGMLIAYLVVLTGVTWAIGRRLGQNSMASPR